MKKKGILLAAVILLSTAPLALAQEGQLSGTVDVTFLSRYIWRGFDVYTDDHSAIQPSIDLDLYGTGLGLSVFWSRANNSGFENVEELDTTLYYYNNLFEGEAYDTDYRIGWVYYNFPDNSYKANDMQEFFATLSWPEICPAGVVPSYTVVRMWPTRSGSNVSGNSGWMHIIGFGYDLETAGLVPETPEQTIHLAAELVYNDGAAPGSVATGANVDHDWSHVLFGASTDFELYDNLVFTPGVHWQASMDNSVNNDEEIWVSLSMSYKF